ncbi:sulfatase-like hydrolase/transferase [Algoriphagus halophilus]|uniref:Arylsulfatase n=1 Tax=Algoriphagus halophilus TaxID=226505 RepID=A0A1N6DGW4_9BACT|nr:sulfatase-like hydrolase/transferase [Algoriphagus halophilus]SIN70020.1 arylsulfatase [Algoriphagus halophilus]
MKRKALHLTLIGLFLVIGYFESNAQSFNRAIKTVENFEPSIPHPEQDKDITQKLAELEKKTGKKPNIVWIIIDDLGYGEPGAYGGGAAIGAATPAMDKLAAEGLKLTSCYSQQTCTPTRSAILTGRLPVRTGLTRPILAGDKITKNPWADEVSLPKLLSDNGYYTLLTGKWHVGEAEGMRPHDVGFDEYYGYYPAQKEITQGIDPRRFPDLVLNEELIKAFETIRPANHLTHGFKDGTTNELEEIKSLGDMGRADHKLADFTISKIKELSGSDKPFFIEHCFMKVHADNFDNPDYPGLSAAKYPYKNAVVEVDMHIGRILKALEEAGELENTFVFVTSDNGPQMDAWPDGGYTPFRGAKGTTFEGGVRVPGIAYWKGMISPGRASDDVFDLMDLFGTSLRLAGISQDELPDDRYYDFIDQSSFLFHDNGKGNRESVYFWWGTELMGIRMREYKEHIKVIIPQAPHMWIDYATIQDVGLAPWLFNLYIDPKEEMPVGHRRNAWLASLGAQLKSHAATFKKYPPKNIGL